ncbi:MAG: FAD-binding oxidoreductase [Nanoarchaeota archaeon]|nr:FAD-binding oxidoreductase [Nanoarchaeota archaeon]
MKTENKKLQKVYESDASNIIGKSCKVFIPENIEEVKKLASELKKIVIRGGGTGLAGGAVPQKDDNVLDLSKLIKIENPDEQRMAVIVEAGVILDDLQDFLEKRNLEFPINPSSHSICTIGGMIATNAVGNRALKYGRTSQWIKWIDVVDGFGNLSRKGITEMSDYSGMEGFTGIIARACLKLTEKKTRTATLVKADNIEEVVAIVRNMKRDESVSMIEFIDKIISKGIGLENCCHLIIEYENELGILKDTEYKKVLLLRDKIYPFVANQGFIRIEDPKIPIDKFEKLSAWLSQKGIPVFGHLSVGILHPCFNKEQEKYIPEMIEIVKKIGGQVSGEHGIGLLKKSFVEINDKKIIENIKKRTDPLNKFNEGKVI